MDYNKYNELVVKLVNDCHNEMLEKAKELGITEIDFTQCEDVEILSARFEDDDYDIDYQEIAKIEFDFKEKQINITSSEGRVAYIDSYWGDYFDVGNAFCKVYQMFAQYINLNYENNGK